MAKTYTPESFIREKIAKQRYAARSVRGISWSVDEDQLVANILADSRCRLSGRSLAFEPGYIETVSLDRIDSRLGYSDTNIQWVGASANTAKNNLTDEQFIELCADIARHNGYVCYKEPEQLCLDFA